MGWSLRALEAPISCKSRNLDAGICGQTENIFTWVPGTSCLDRSHSVCPNTAPKWVSPGHCI